MEESGRSVADMKRRLEEQNGRLLLTRGSLDNGRRQRIHNQSLKLFQVNPQESWKNPSKSERILPNPLKHPQQSRKILKNPEKSSKNP